ncbi:hypothetical protein P280DRAFT_434294 [Massarina eburnea CBS 473.64]|uniref:RBR-type E3 ubiquitin transferase n=1 Tax=Massarina eburnea CBS 473.64 TaxID=1395130 RepID=A0A6A6RM74_9PLEO|nr:hypothetical protein P280DRAFT_434294 [Massarina eburnea CBS 473.64]
MAAIQIVPALDPYDDEMTALALQLEEIGIVGQKAKGKYPMGSPPDNKIAVDSFQTEIQTHLDFLRDLKLAHSIAQAIDTDAQAIADMVRPEEQVQEDRRLAIRLHGEEPTGEDIVEMSQPKLAGFFPLATPLIDLSDDESEVGPSMTYAQRQAKVLGKLSTEYRCCACYGNFKSVSTVVASCEDRYCRDCLKSLFLRATTDESLFPPRCCRKSIPLEMISGELSSDELNAFRQAEVEFSTTDRTYCSNASCAKFVPGNRIQAGRAICGICSTETCSMCKNAYHRGTDCRADPALQATLALAHDQGWQRCNSCRSMVEMTYGCNHMTCNCGAQFCYVCGADWKTCSCAQWNEDRLYARARGVVIRDAEGQLPHFEINRRVEMVRNGLRVNHECRHPRWLDRLEGWRRNCFRCEVCTRRYSQFILQCPTCHIQICADCKRNRMR